MTREQVATILYNYAQRTGNDTSYRTTPTTAFPTLVTSPLRGTQAMKWAVTHKILNGSSGKLGPQGHCHPRPDRGYPSQREKGAGQNGLLPTPRHCRPGTDRRTGPPPCPHRLPSKIT